jgi:hypothetical protein
MSKTLREYSYFLFLSSYQKPSKTIKNPSSIQLFMFYEGYLLPPKTILTRQNAKSIQLDPKSEKFSKTIKNHQKPPKTLRVFSYSCFLRSILLLQKPSRNIKNP